MPIALRGLAINIKPLIVALILVLLLGVFFYRAKIPEVAETLFHLPPRLSSAIDWRFLLGKLAIERPIEEIAEVEEEAVPKEEILIAAPERFYQMTAQPGEGITHLARRSLKTYLEEKETDFNLTPEHKVYIEDYIQKQTGDRWLMLGETLTFSEELIVEAIQKAQELTPDQLENLKQYSALVVDF